MILSSDRSRRRTTRRKVGLKGMHQDLSSYIGFSFYSIFCLALFVIVYTIMLLTLVPLLSNNMTLEETLKDAPAPVLEAMEAAGKLRGQWRQLRNLSGVTDESLLEETIREFTARKNFMKHVH